MADYVMVLDRDHFEGQLRPLLSESYRQRSFAPCHAAGSQWAGMARAYAERYHIDPTDMLLPRLPTGLVFDRAVWRAVVGEVLLVTAVELPELPPHVESLVHLLAPGARLEGRREHLPAILQALHGSRDVRLGLAVYRPDHAGLNDSADVSRLAQMLGAVSVQAWAADDLLGVAGLEDPDDREEELDFAREWLGELAAVYRRAAEARRVMVLESIY